jgi:ankyrin repeat protein
MIHKYAIAGNSEGVTGELRSGIPVDARDDEDYTPLARAAGSRNANESLLQILIDFGANVNCFVDHSKKFPLSLAACTGSLDKVRCLLRSGADVGLASPPGYTALINAAYALHSDELLLPMLELLIQYGADVNLGTQYGESLLSVTSLRGRFDAVMLLLNAGADPVVVGWTPLMVAIAAGRYDDVERHLNHTSGLWDRDCFGRSPWLLAAGTGNLAIAKLLLSAGAEVNDFQRGQVTALMDCCRRGDVEMVSWLIANGATVDAEDSSGDTALFLAAQEGATDCVRRLLEAGANPSHRNQHQESAIAKATIEPIIRMLLDAGVPHSELSTEAKRAILGFHDTDTWTVSEQEYQEACQPRFGRSNPELVNYPFWNEMVRNGHSAYHARMQFGDTHSNATPVWCFSRFGMSFNELPDGRFVQIGGEHEDFYDPDFYIYNDVIVHESTGHFQIRIYPQEVFPPTDFHSATYVNGFIYIVGGLGYQGWRRFNTTPVYRLCCQTWKIEQVESFGEKPGWIFKHEASTEGKTAILVSGGESCREIKGKEKVFENRDAFRLDLTRMIWTRVP